LQERPVYFCFQGRWEEVNGTKLTSKEKAKSDGESGGLAKSGNQFTRFGFNKVVNHVDRFANPFFPTSIKNSREFFEDLKNAYSCSYSVKPKERRLYLSAGINHPDIKGPCSRHDLTLAGFEFPSQFYHREQHKGAMAARMPSHCEWN